VRGHIPAILAGLTSLVAAPSGGKVGLAPSVQVSQFEATRRVIGVETRVADQEGRQVENLRPGQFALSVDGLACPRLAAEWIAVPKPSSKLKRQPSGGSPRQADLVDGRIAGTAARVVLLIDFVNTAPVDRMRLLAALRNLLSTPALDGERIEVAELLPPIEVLRPFTSDIASLRDVVAGIKPLAGGPGPPPAFQYDPVLLSPGPKGAAARRQLAFLDHIRSEEMLAGFRSLTLALAPLAGRKVVLWLTADASALNPSLAFQFSLQDPAEQPIGIPRAELRDTFRGLNAADVTIWPLQIRGVSNPGMVAAASAAGGPVQDLQLFQESRAGDARLAMFTVANATGGFVFEGNNDLVGLLRRALSLAQGYYLLSCSFTLDSRVPHGHALRDGKLLLAPGYHAIKVRVQRRGVKVLARRGVLVPAQRQKKRGDLPALPSNAHRSDRGNSFS